MSNKDLEELKKLLTAYGVEKCKTYKEAFKNCPSCSDCPAQGIYFSSKGDIIAKDCIIDTLVSSIKHEIDYHNWLSGLGLGEDYNG